MSTFVAVILSVSGLKLKLQMLLLISILTVRIINPKNKRDFMELMWHNISEKFDSVKLKLIDSLLEYDHLQLLKWGIWGAVHTINVGLCGKRI